MGKWRIIVAVVVACLLTAVMLTIGVYTNYHNEFNDEGCSCIAGERGCDCPAVEGTVCTILGCGSYDCYVPSNSLLFVITAPVSALTMLLQGTLLAPTPIRGYGLFSCDFTVLSNWTYPLLQFPYYFAISYFLVPFISKAKIFGRGKQAVTPKLKS